MKKYQITYRRNEKYWGGVLKGKRHIFADSAKHAKRWFKTANPDAFDIVVSEVYSFSA
tara:strand:+ start:446 stop:619 length:174 start_codon:yes stop_codon:yes gene_type:complete